MHSTVTNQKLCRLLSITIKNIKTMRTLNNNHLTATLRSTNSNTWNSKRRFR